jgi:hypothetical protein
VLGFVLLIGVGWMAYEINGRARAQAMVDTVSSARTSDVAGMQSELAHYRSWAAPLLRARLAAPDLPAAARLNLTLALLPYEPERLDELAPRLFEESLEDFDVLREALAGQAGRVVTSLWQNVADEAVEPGRRLRAACALTRYDPSAVHAPSGSWRTYAKVLAEAVVAAARRDPGAYSRLMNNLRPIGASLREPLGALMRDPGRGEADRSLALALLLDHLAKQPLVLAELLTETDVQQFPLVWRALAAQAGMGHSIWRNVLKRAPAPESSEAARDRLAAEHANAALALFLTGQQDEAQTRACALT